MKTSSGTSSTAITASAPNTVSHAGGSVSRVTAKNEMKPAMPMLMMAIASRSRAIDAVVTCGLQRSSSSSTFSGSPVTPRTVKKLIASAARRTRNRRTNGGRESSGNEIAQPQVRRNCQTTLGIRTSGSARPRRFALPSVASRSMWNSVKTNRPRPRQIAAIEMICGTERAT